MLAHSRVQSCRLREEEKSRLERGSRRGTETQRHRLESTVCGLRVRLVLEKQLAHGFSQLPSSHMPNEKEGEGGVRDEQTKTHKA